ncbi:outer membrane protein assembly factor BamE [Aurantimonas sp. C2-6-R+9]|nr:MULTISPECIES: outer membrane protein assembly factor BamE [unclassified Aurantimonas]MEC5290596.1 outer membrane protein assembly factor BamE [Aurantimonas sp. C2-3-R2]MEC5325039.1 outer membrane protein assembly factor BamE [Aurantimonas sp. A3-2-R12]MEC5380689.1 outer membrane protein assembly factor BamE [Aurantimonas sp. C2-6-R+9]MEC5411736.1 outer membrane protein assembly factor BamE [Aurantimonas sp. C2-4-R8]
MISVNSSVRLKRSMLASAAVAAVLALSACSTSEVLNQGYVVDEKSLELVPVGSSREQVLLALGSPSTTATFDNEVFYYISQKRVRPVAFMQPQLVDQKVLAVYFNADGRVERIANYGLQNGQLFDFISRTTTTGGKDKTFLGQILTDTGSGGRGIRL